MQLGIAGGRLLQTTVASVQAGWILSLISIIPLMSFHRVDKKPKSGSTEVPVLAEFFRQVSMHRALFLRQSLAMSSWTMVTPIVVWIDGHETRTLPCRLCTSVGTVRVITMDVLKYGFGVDPAKSELDKIQKKKKKEKARRTIVVVRYFYVHSSALPIEN